MSEDQDYSYNVQIDPDWFKWVVHKQDSSIRKLGASESISKTERTIRRAIKAKSMCYELLDEIAQKLDVYPDYLAGKYAWTLNLDIMDEDGVRDYWRENYLHPSHFPYQLVEQERLGLRKQLLDTLLIHGISEADYRALTWEQRRDLRQDIDQRTTQALLRWFPDSARPAADLEYFQTMEWRKDNVGDVIDTMFDYLRERGLIEVYDPEPDENYVSPFEEKYKFLPVVSMPAFERIVIKGESGFCSINEAYTDTVTITPDWIRYKYEPRELSEHNLPMSWAYQPSGLGYRALFDEVAEKVAGILEQDDEEFVADVGSTTFAVTYPNGTKKHRVFYLPGDDFAECFALVKKMVPSEEAIPRVLLTSDDE